jgi:hypothetical protein
MFMALLQQQSDNFRGFVKNIMDPTNTRLDALSRQLQDIKSSQQDMQKDVDDIKNVNINPTECSRANRLDLYKICDSLLVATDKYLEGQSRRKRKELRPELKAVRERGEVAYLSHDKLVIHPRPNTKTTQRCLNNTLIPGRIQVCYK